MKTLAELHDKNPDRYHGTDKESKHKYLSLLCGKEFLKFQGQEVNLLEIGILKGGSLLLWSDYFPNGHIYGVDINDWNGESKNNTKDVPNIKIDIADAYSVEYVNSLPELDIVIDDGPHSVDSQVECIKLYLPKLKNGGILIIEDIESVAAVGEFIKVIPPNCDFEFIDTGSDASYDNRIFVLRKK